ncbi:MAG: response regulator, partial [Desulfofustis sp.]
MKIVFIENYVAAREVFSLYLSQKGYTIDVYSEPDEEVLTKIIYDIESQATLLLLVDYKLPIMNGLDTIEYLKGTCSKLNLNNTYILTNYPALVDPHKLKTVGCKLAQKPVTLAEIDSFIGKATEELPK